jgi:hypothetical protein
MDSAQAIRSANIFAEVLRGFVRTKNTLEGAESWIRNSVEDPYVIQALPEIMPLAMDFVDGVLNRREFYLMVASEIQKADARANYAKAVSKVAATATKISNRLKQDINKDLIRAGMGGNKHFSRLGMALNDISAVLFSHGITHDLMTGDRFRGENGTAKLGLETYQEIPNGDPITSVVTNSLLVITFHKFEHTGNWEVIAYVS